MLRRGKCRKHDPLTKRQHLLRILRPAPGTAKPPGSPSTEPIFVIGFAPEKFCPGAARRRKILQTTWHKAYSEYPPFTHKVRTSYPQGLRLAKPPIPHYLVSRSQRTTRYRGSCKITHKSQPAKSSDFPGELQVIPAAKPLLRRRPRQALSGPCSGMGATGRAWHPSATVFGPSPEPLTSARERRAIAPYS